MIEEVERACVVDILKNRKTSREDASLQNY